MNPREQRALLRRSAQRIDLDGIHEALAWRFRSDNQEFQDLCLQTLRPSKSIADELMEELRKRPIQPHANPLPLK